MKKEEGINPQLSIIIPTFNAEKALAECLNSVVDQTFSDYEIIIVDGDSQDNTLKIIQDYSKRYSQIKWSSAKDQGIYDAMNKGIISSTGEWLFFLGSDDRFFDNSTLERVFIQNKSILDTADLIYGDFIPIGKGYCYGKETDLLSLYHTNICHQTMFHRRKIFNKLGYYNNKYKALADWDMNLKIFADYSLKKVYLHYIISYFYPEGFHYHHLKKDEFFKDREDNFNALMKQQSFKLRLKWLLRKEDFIINKFSKRLKNFYYNYLRAGVRLVAKSLGEKKA